MVRSVETPRLASLGRGTMTCRSSTSGEGRHPGKKHNSLASEGASFESPRDLMMKGVLEFEEDYDNILRYWPSTNTHQTSKTSFHPGGNPTCPHFRT